MRLDRLEFMSPDAGLRTDFVAVTIKVIPWCADGSGACAVSDGILRTAEGVRAAATTT